MSDLFHKQDLIGAIYVQSDDDGYYVATVEDMEEIIKGLPSAEPEQTHNIMDFVGYQVAWLESHNDIELEPELEKWIVRMLYDTAERYIMEHPETERKTGKWIIEIEEEHTEKYDARIPHWFCSCCRTEYDPYSATRVNYCSNCGVKMEVER